MRVLVNDFIRSKWRQAHRFFDVDKDGVITEEDYISIADNLSKLSNATIQQAAQCRQEFITWVRLLKPDPSVIVDESRFEAVCEELYRADLKEYIKLNVKTANLMFDRIDINGDGFISWEEFAIFYEAVGIKDKKLTRANFAKIDRNGDGELQREEYVEEIVRHYTDPDPITGVTFFFKNRSTDMLSDRTL